MAAVDRAAAMAIMVLSAPAAAAFSFDDAAAPAYERCALCHGLFGDSPRQKFPRLAGQRQAYIEKQIGAFLDGRRSNDGGQMVSVVTELTSAQISEAAAWFADLPHPTPAADGGTDGELLWIISGCGDCHAESAKDDPDMPWLSAQHPVYLSKQMRDIRDGLRPGNAKGRMQTQLRALTDPDIDTLAAWLSAQERRE
jgi:cytochrome c553